MISQRSIVYIVAWSLIVVMSSVKADESTKLGEVASKFLERAASQDGSKYSYKDKSIVVAGNRIKVTPISENILLRGASHISAARFEITINDQKRPELTFGSIGIGGSPEDATKTAVFEWYMAAGQALFAAISGEPTESKFPGVSIYPGLMGVRGEHPDGWLDGTPKMNARIFEVIKEQVPATQKLNAIDLKIVVNATGSVDGQCTVNGRESAAAIEELRKLDWPETKSSYMLKQTYIITRTPKSEQGAPSKTDSPLPGS